MRPVSSGRLRSVGRVVNRNKSQIIAEAVVYDSKGNELGRVSGVFVRSKLPLGGALGYAA
jgi:acyl-coenzyme A thioesterase PaaI-like protein